MAYVDRSGLKVGEPLAAFIENECLDGAGLSAGDFWKGLAGLLADLTPGNRVLLARRDALQAKIDAWHDARNGKDIDQGEYLRFLREIGYLVDEPAPFSIKTENVDPEIATMAGPQLVVPSRNARFALNAANARWGSLYDALYGTDALPGTARPGGYDKARGEQVIAAAQKFLDEIAPLASGRHGAVDAYLVEDGALKPALKNPAQFVGWRGAPASPSAILLKNNGLHVEIAIDRAHPIGKDARAGVCDVVLEAALTTIIDLEDSIAAVDAQDKTEAYRNWLGLLKGTLEASFPKGGGLVRRSLEDDRDYVAPDGEAFSLTGRSVLLVRNVGHLMTTPAILNPDGSEAFEGLVDAVVTGTLEGESVRQAARAITRSLFAARTSAREVVTANNIRQLSIAIIAFADQNNGKLPDSLDELAEFVGGKEALAKLLAHPITGEAAGVQYTKVSAKWTDVKMPSTAVILREIRDGKVYDAGWVGFLDGHIERGDQPARPAPKQP